MKRLLMLICMSKSKQLLNFHSTLFSYFIYLTEWFQQQTEFTADFETILDSFFIFFLEAERFKICKKHLPFWPCDVLNRVICARSCSMMRDYFYNHLSNYTKTKLLLCSGSWILVNITLKFISGNIHQYSLHLWWIIVKYLSTKLQLFT